MPTEELVSVTILVPRQDVKRAYDWASSRLDNPPASETGNASVPPEGISPTGSATSANELAPELIRLQFVESPPFMQQFQKILAAEPGREFSTVDLAARLDAKNGWKSVVGALGAYGRRTSNRYHMKKWPFKAAKNHADGLFYYSIEAETAKIIEGL